MAGTHHIAEFAVVPGGSYRARQNQDGTWNVLDVPIFSVIDEGTKGAPRDITNDDLRVAVEEHERRFREDRFLARLNVYHNDGFHPTRGVGFFIPRSVRPLRLGGVTRPTIFADLIAVSDETFREIDAGDLPYRSVEVRTWEPLRFGALALLDSEPPFFEYPLLTIGERAEVDQAVSAFCDEPCAALARFSFQEGSPMPDDAPKPKKDDDGQMAESEKLDIEAVCKAIREGDIALGDFEKLKAEMAAREAAEVEEPVDDDVVDDEPIPALKADATNRMSHDVAELKGELFALKRKQNEREAREARERMFREAVDSLTSDGYAIDDQLTKELREMSEQGETAFTAFVRSYRRVTEPDPPEYLEGGARFDMSGVELPSEVVELPASKQPEAAALFSEWSQLPADKHRSSFKQYLARHLDAQKVGG